MTDLIAPALTPSEADAVRTYMQGVDRIAEEWLIANMPNLIVNLDGPDWRNELQGEYSDIVCPRCKDPIYGRQCGGCFGGW